jgi:hypothetical protein
VRNFNSFKNCFTRILKKEQNDNLAKKMHLLQKARAKRQRRFWLPTPVMKTNSRGVEKNRSCSRKLKNLGI